MIFFNPKLLTVISLLAFATTANGQLSPTDFETPEYFRNWGLKYTLASQAYALGFTGAGIKIGIADGQAQISHPEFVGRSYWPMPYPPFPTPGYPDFPEHGTHVMGIAAAARNGVGMMGVAFDASIANVVRIGSPGYPESDDWVQELINAGVSVMNGSFGPTASPNPELPDGTINPYYDPDQPAQFQFLYGGDVLRYAEAAKTLADADIVMVFAANNNRASQPIAAENPQGIGMIPLVTVCNTALSYGNTAPGCTNNPPAAIYRIFDEGADDQNPATWTDANQIDESFALQKSQEIEDLKLAGTLIAVAAININEQTNEVELADFSNECGFAADWCMAAPGVDIYSTVPLNTYADGAKWSGTSMAAPHVAGSAAVLRQAFPYMTARQIIEVLLTTATGVALDPDLGPVLDLRQDTDPTQVAQFGHGLVNLGRAVRGPIEFGHPSLIPGNESIFAPIFAVDTGGYDSVWSNDIIGTGGFSKAGEGMLTLTGTNTYQGATTITGGVLRVNGSIVNSVLTVEAGTTLQGIGSVANTTIAGVLSPGNSVGTLTVNGNLDLLPGSTYLYEIDANQNGDLVVVNGNVTVADGVVFELSAEDGVYLNQPYQMFQTTGTLSVSSGVTHTDYTFIDLNFVAANGNLSFDIERNTVPMASFAQTNNQRAVATAIDGQSSGAEPYNDALLNEDPSQLPGWYQDWSGEIYSANQAALIYNSRLLAQVVNWRLQDSWLDATQSARLQQVGQTNQDTTVWAQAYGNWDTFSADANAQKARANSGGFILGVDHRLSPNFRLGGGFSASVTNTSVAASSADTSGYHVMLYGTYNQEKVRLNAGVVQSWYTANVNRTLPLDDQGNANGTVASRSTQLFADLSSPITLNRQDRHGTTHQTTLSPFGQVSQIWLSTSNFGETGAEAGLTGQATNASTGFGTLGARLSHQWQANETNWQASLSVGWQRAWGDRAPTTTLAFATGPAFTVSAAAIAQDSAVVELGIGASMGPSSRFNLVYSTTISGQSTSQMLQAQLQWWF